MISSIAGNVCVCDEDQDLSMLYMKNRMNESYYKINQNYAKTNLYKRV